MSFPVEEIELVLGLEPRKCFESAELLMQKSANLTH